MEKPFIHHTPRDGAEHRLEPRHAKLWLDLTMGSKVIANINILATLPAHTPDDRGEVDWTAPIGLDFTTAGWMLGAGHGLARLLGDVAEDLDNPRHVVGHFYHYDHAQFATLRYRLRTSAPDGWWVEAAGRSMVGDEFSLALPVLLVTVVIRAGAAMREEAEAFALEVVGDGLSQLTRTEQPYSGIVLKAVRPRD